MPLLFVDCTSRRLTACEAYEYTTDNTVLKTSRKLLCPQHVVKTFLEIFFYWLLLFRDSPPSLGALLLLGQGSPSGAGIGKCPQGGYPISISGVFCRFRTAKSPSGLALRGAHNLGNAWLGLPTPRELMHVRPAGRGHGRWRPGNGAESQREAPCFPAPPVLSCGAFWRSRMRGLYGSPRSKMKAWKVLLRPLNAIAEDNIKIPGDLSRAWKDTPDTGTPRTTC